MRPTIAALARLLCLLGPCLLAPCCGRDLPVIELEVGGQSFRVEVARTPQERAKGLKGRSSLGSGQGMLFVFEADQNLEFWMQDTPIPLSIAFISAKGQVLEIRDMKPLSLDPVRSRLKARYALEMNQGAFAAAGVAPGDQLVFPEGFR